MEIKLNTTDNKRDLVKAGNATIMFKDVIGDTIKLVGILIYNKEEVDAKTGEVSTKTVSCIKKDDGEFISSISPTVQNSLELLASSYDKEEIAKGIDVVVKTKQSNSKRDFLYIDLV